MAYAITVTIPALDAAEAARFADVLKWNVHEAASRKAFPIVRSITPVSGGFTILFDALVSERALTIHTLACAHSLADFYPWHSVGATEWV